MTPATSPHGVTFGYFPDSVRIDTALEYGPFTRALVIDMPVRSLIDHVSECRVLWQPDVELPEGIYWFHGVDGGSLLMQVATGAPPGGRYGGVARRP